MFRRLIFSLLTALEAAGCASPAQTNWQKSQGPVQWGDPVNGLQVGIAAQFATAPPGQPQGPVTPLEGVKVYLRNQGESTIQIVDPTNAVLGGPPGAAALLGILTDPPPLTRVSLSRPDWPRVLTLVPSQTIGLSVQLPVPLDGQNVVAQYENDDSVITIAPPSGARAAQTVQDVWTGQARSAELEISPEQ